jgi:hypothetical protein
MATVTTVRTQKQKEPNYPYPPKFKSLEDVQSYLKLLYAALKENRDTGYAGSVFMSSDPPQDFIGRDGDIYIETED